MTVGVASHLVNGELWIIGYEKVSSFIIVGFSGDSDEYDLGFGLIIKQSKSLSFKSSSNFNVQ